MGKDVVLAEFSDVTLVSETLLIWRFKLIVMMLEVVMEAVVGEEVNMEVGGWKRIECETAQRL